MNHFQICFFKAFIKRIKRRLLHLRLQPIRVFCFHVVSDVFDSQTMWKCDWMSVEGFKGTINHLLSKKYKFISWTDAYKHICEDRVRYRKYAVVTFDDGDSSIMNVMPWLTKKRIPVTLFVNPGILSSDYLREKPIKLFSMAFYDKGSFGMDKVYLGNKQNNNQGTP